MRIALSVDAMSRNPTGIGRYCRELSVRLPKHESVHELLCFRGADLVRDPSPLVHGDFSHKFKYLNRLSRKIDRIVLARKAKGCVVHGPNYFLPDWADRGIVTIHDLSVFLYPETHPAERIFAFERNFAQSVKRAAHIITDSETVKQEVLDFTGLPSSRVTAVPLGVDGQYRPRTDVEIASVIDRFSLQPCSYGLCVSTFEPRKRIDLLLDAWGYLPAQVRACYPLVLAGGSGWNNEALHVRLQQASDQGWLRNLGYVTEAELIALYAGARLFAYPSSYEGFGLPPLEAMASGVPVIVSNTSCLPEVTGGAAALVNPADVDGFRDAIMRALQDESWRTAAIIEGYRVVGRYRWENCVERTVDIYRTVGGA